jgi:hypothetical protein
MEILQMMKMEDLHVVDLGTMDLPKVLGMFCILIGTWDLLPQHLTQFESLFCTLYTKRVLIQMLMFGFSERPLMQMEKKTMQISIVLFYTMANSLKDKANDSLLVTFFRVGLQPYLHVAMALAKCDNLFQQKEVDVHYEKNMGNVKDQWKILEPPNKLEKDNKKDLICGHCHKPNHTKECCHWNLKNPKEGRGYY